MPDSSAPTVGAGAVAAGPGASRRATAQTSEHTRVTPPTTTNAPRHPASAISAASGADAARAPTTPTVADTADRNPKRSGGNHAAAILSAPMNVTVAPSPTAKRPAKSSAVPPAA